MSCQSYLSIASNIPNAVFVILNAAFGQKFALKKRIVRSLGLIVAFFILITSLSLFNSDAWQNTFMILTLSAVVVINCATAVFQGGVFGAAGKFAPLYIGGVMAGQAVGGIFPALVEVLVVAVEIAPQDIGFASFAVATFVLIVALIAFIVVNKNNFFVHYANAENADAGNASNPKKAFQVLIGAWPFCLSVFVTFMTTLVVFPSVAVLIESTYPYSTPWSIRYFTPVTCFVLFNVGDYLGRVFAAKLRLDKYLGSKFLVSASVLRLLFIPAFMLCNAAPAKRTLPVIFDSDSVYIMMMAAFAVSNGLLGNLCFLRGPKVFASPAEQETAAMVLVACLVCGTGIGSALSYPVVEAL